MSPVCNEIDLQQALTDEIGYASPAIEKIFASQHGDRVTVWTVVDDFKRSVRNLIYEAEERLIERHPELQFDFNVLDSGEVSGELGETLVFTR